MLETIFDVIFYIILCADYVFFCFGYATANDAMDCFLTIILTCIIAAIAALFTGHFLWFGVALVAFGVTFWASMLKENRRCPRRRR